MTIQDKGRSSVKTSYYGGITSFLIGHGPMKG